MPNHALRNATHRETFDPGTSMGTDHDEIAFVRFGTANDGIVRDARIDA